MTSGYESQYKNWFQLTSKVELITLARGGHFFIKENTADTAEVILNLAEK